MPQDLEFYKLEEEPHVHAQLYDLVYHVDGDVLCGTYLKL